MSFKPFKRHGTVELTLGGLRIGSPQTMGSIRMVPLLRDGAPGDLRIDRRAYGNALGIVSLDGKPDDPNLVYFGYVPQGFVMSYTNDMSAPARDTTKSTPSKTPTVMHHHRLVKGEKALAVGTERFRMLPLDLAMDGYLADHFAGPETWWSEYSERVRRFGMSPRVEHTMRMQWVRGMRDAVATFEVHAAQVGVMVYVADALATVFVVSHPEDYRTLHGTLLEDFVGDLLVRYAFFYDDLPYAIANVDPQRVGSLDDLRAEATRVREEWRELGVLLGSGLAGARVDVERVRDMGPFTLERFLPEFDESRECHIGERIVRKDGTLEYMKTFRLSLAQTRRGYLLKMLAQADWHVDNAAAAMGCTRKILLERLVKAGFGHMLNAAVLQELSKP